MIIFFNRNTNFGGPQHHGNVWSRNILRIGCGTEIIPHYVHISGLQNCSGKSGVGQGNLGLYPCFPYFFLHADILVKIGGIHSIFDTQNDKIIRENYFV